MTRHLRKDKCDMGKKCPLVHPQKKKRSSSPVRKELGETQQSDKGIGCNCEYCKLLFKDYFRKAPAICYTPGTPPSKPRETLSKWCNPQCPWRAFWRSDGKPPSEKTGIRFSCQSLVRATFSDKFPSLNMIQTCSENARHINAPPCDERSTEWNQKQEEFARHKAHKLHTELFKMKGHNNNVLRKKKLFRSYVPTKAKNTAIRFVMHSKERVHIVDSGVSLHIWDYL